MKSLKSLDVQAALLLISILGTLAAPAIQGARSAARKAHCQDNLRKVGVASADYRWHYDGDLRTFPVATYAKDFSAYLRDQDRVFLCPEDNGERPEKTSYGVNNLAYRFRHGDAQKILAIDYRSPAANVVGSDAQPKTWYNQVAPRHRGSVNILRWDGSVLSAKPDDVDPNIPTLHDGYWRPTDLKEDGDEPPENFPEVTAGRETRQAAG